MGGGPCFTDANVPTEPTLANVPRIYRPLSNIVVVVVVVDKILYV